MITVDELKKMKLQALKEKDKIKGDFFGIIISSIQKAEIEKKAENKTLADSDISSILLKLNKELEEDRKMYSDNGREEEVRNITRQIEILKPLLPQMMSREEITEKMDVTKSMKEVIAEFKGKAEIPVVIEIYKKLTSK
ncbi:MAG: GatB/YqeY domain-containing protein [Candidatus Enterosoma sp.]|nr:GatB/YqeY domain-containing protein [bacterium]MDY5865900.1 GatB/YqeY domain-containing protein [Candidatus Enterosoma sp.]